MLEKQYKCSKWRVCITILSSIALNQSIFNIQILNLIYIPVLFKIMEEGCVELKHAACKNLVKFLRINCFSEKNALILSKMNATFMNSKTY